MIHLWVMEEEMNNNGSRASPEPSEEKQHWLKAPSKLRAPKNTTPQGKIFPGAIKFKGSFC